MSITSSKDKSYLLARDRVLRREEQIFNTKRHLMGDLPDPAEDGYVFGSLIRAVNDNFRSSIERPKRLNTDERLIGRSNDIVSIEFLEKGILAGRPVGRISFLDNKFDGIGTGFLVAPSIIMTNNHVIPDSTTADGMFFRLNYEENQSGEMTKYFDYNFDSKAFFLTNEELDYTLIGLDQKNGGAPPPSKFGWHTLSPRSLKTKLGDPINIIQHPLGRPKSIVVHNSNLLLMDKKEDTFYCWYSGDTRKGSSGAPVFDRHWDLIALHHQAVEKRDKNGYVVDKTGRKMTENEAITNQDKIQWIANEGIRTVSIFQSVKNWQPSSSILHKRKMNLLENWSNPKVAKTARLDSLSR